MLADEEQFRALMARVYAQGLLIETLATAGLAFGGPEFAKMVMGFLRSTANGPGAPGTMSDIAAELHADVAVRAREALEPMLARIGSQVAGFQAGRAG